MDSGKNRKFPPFTPSESEKDQRSRKKDKRIIDKHQRKFQL